MVLLPDLLGEVKLMSVLFLPLIALIAQDPQDIATAVNEAAVPFMENGQTIGMSMAIVKDGRFYFFNFGETSKGNGKTPTSKTRYYIGSITKTFTGILLAQAALGKKVALGDDVRKYMDGRYDNLEFGGQPIRLWHLVNHLSGLPFNLPERTEPWTLPGYDPGKSFVAETDALRRYTAPDLYRDLRKVTLTRTPGTQFSYSNAGAQLLGLVLERIGHASYERLLTKGITGPLGMSNTKVVLTAKEKDLLPRGESQSGPLLPAVSTIFPAAGSMTSTVEDMAKYVAWNIRESDEAVRLSHTPPEGEAKDNSFYIGLNWQILKSKGVRVIFQDGNLPGFHSMCVFYPELNLGAVILTNGKDQLRPAPLSPLFDKILRRIDPRIPTTP